MNSNTPTISVVLPTYNRSDVLPRAIDSVLEQTYEDFELIVVDDGSTDNTEKIVRQYEDKRIKYVKHCDNKNGSAARNTGIEISKGNYIAFLDSDDVWMPKKLAYQYQYMDELEGDYIGCYCNYRKKRGSAVVEIIDQVFTRNTKKVGDEDLIEDILSLSFDHGGSSTLFIDSESVRRVDGFDESFDRHQDLEFLIRLLQIGKLGYVDEVLVTKFESGFPSPNKVKSAKEKFLNKFNNDIDHIDIDNEHILYRHYIDLSKIYFKNGKIIRGMKILPLTSVIGARDCFGLIFSLIVGLNSRSTENR